MDCEVSEFAESDLASAALPTCLRIGDVDVAIRHQGVINLSPEIKKFRTPDAPTDINVTLRWSKNILPPVGAPSFDSGAVWKLTRENDDFVFDFATPAICPHPYKRLRTSDFISAEIILNSSVLLQDAWALEYPADELLITNYLARYGLGVEVHGCGMVDSERGGFLFLGHSGAGKSTTTRLWQSTRNPEILSDDRIILRIHDRKLWMYGTPWHGEAAFASAAKSKLNRVFILEHGPVNRVTQLTPAQAVGELFARCFPPFHSAQGLQNTIEFLERVVYTVPCYEFQFVPDQSAVQLALNFHD